MPGIWASEYALPLLSFNGSGGILYGGLAVFNADFNDNFVNAAVNFDDWLSDELPVFKGAVVSHPADNKIINTIWCVNRNEYKRKKCLDREKRVRKKHICTAVKWSHAAYFYFIFSIFLGINLWKFLCRSKLVKFHKFDLAFFLLWLLFMDTLITFDTWNGN